MGLLQRILRAARRSDNPRRTMVSMVLKAHGWRQPWRSAAWFPPGESVTFGCPVTVRELRRRGFGAEADHLMGAENMLMNWAADACCGDVRWDRRE